MAQKRKHSDPEIEEDVDNQNVFQSTTIEDRSSTFTAYFSPTLSPKELQRLSVIQNASHKILAWRKESAQRSITPGRTQYTADHDDDGERNGGSTVERVLDRMNVTGACVVARWYGGVMLGPVRFSHIENCARSAIQAWQNAEREHYVKKRKTKADKKEYQDLVELLTQRDQSVLVLRTLALEKETAVKLAILSGVDAIKESHENKQKEKSPSTLKLHESIPSSSPSAKMDYTALPLERLRAFEKARDATLSFLLKRINKAETDLAAIHKADPP